MHKFTQKPAVSQWIKRTLLSVCVLCAIQYNPFAQSVFTFNALADLEVSKAGEKSHYYYNEIDQNETDLRFGMSQLNLLVQLSPDSNWSFNGRLLLERDKGQKLDKFSTPQLNIQWLSNNRKMGVTLGLFSNPFGSFNDNQLSTQRNFIGLPLAYSYYANISPKIGYLPDMGDVTKVMIDDEVQWGGSILYYGGYTAGAMMSWNIKPAKVNWKIALVNGASNKLERFSKPTNWGIISRLKLQPTYYWEQGLSVSHGSFIQESEVSTLLEDLGMFTQTLIGTDFKLGSGFFEVSGELIGAFYRVPIFDSEARSFDTGANNDPLTVNSWSVYLDIKYEIPMIQGSYVAYRIDHLGFGKLEDSTSPQWDNHVLRHSVALGYHVSRNVLARMAVSTQQVNNKPWNKTQGTFRFVLTAHY
jgi:hypothetical protein